MTKFTLSTDSSCDELKNNLKKVDIHYIPLVYIYNDEAFEDNFTTQEEYQFFYNEEKQSKFFTTAGLNPAMLEEYFENLLKEHKMDVVHVSLSSGISGSFDIAQTVVQRLNEKNENKIYLIDSKSATSGTKLVLNLARKCRDDEMTAKATADFVNEKIKSMTTNFFVCDLDHLRRGGRLSSFQAVIGKMLQLRPMIEFDVNGKLNVYDKIIGTKKAIKHLAEKCIKSYDPTQNEPIYIAHTGNMEMVYILKEMLDKEFKNPRIITSFIGPVIGSHTGPDALGIVYLRK